MITHVVRSLKKRYFVFHTKHRVKTSMQSDFFWVVDEKNKRIKTYTVTDASVHDSQPLVEMLSEKDRVLYADRAYVGEELHEKVQEKCKGINIDANYIVIRIKCTKRGIATSHSQRKRKKRIERSHVFAHE